MLQDNLRLQRRRFLATVLGSGLYFWLSQSQAAAVAKKIETTSEIDDHAIRDAIKKAQNFEHDYPDDIYLNATQSQILTTAQQRLTRLQRTVGYANFNLISFDAAVKYAKRYSVIGAFSLQELALIEMLFANDAKEYGFLGEKVSTTLTDVIRRNDVLKVRGTGHYVYKGEALNTYTKISKVIGPDLQLTSGVRSVVKQLHLFMAKAVKSNGNLSRASRSLAPPGHSFHGIGDFDVGKKGLGAANFTSQFAKTDIYQRLCDLGLISMRYPYANAYGVRHEPWHIKVV